MVEQTWGDIVSGASSGFELLPLGVYDWQIVSADYKPAATGKPMIKVKCVIMNGPLAGKYAFNNLVFADDNPELMGIRVQELNALGLDPDTFQGTLEQVVQQLAGVILNKAFTAELTHRPFNNQQRNQIGIMQKLRAGGDETPMTVPSPTPVPVPQTSPEAVPTPPTNVPPGMPVSADPPPPADGSPQEDGPASYGEDEAPF